MKQSFNDIKVKAEKVLRKNSSSVVRNGVTYRRTVPSKEFYVHQWNWDSATHAMGLVHIDEEMAYDEIRSLLSGQWKNGLVAQITFNPLEKKYFPGPEFWGTEKFANGEILTSGITQPPLLGFALKYVYTHAKDGKKAKAFLSEVLQKVASYHRYLNTYRDPGGSGLLTIIHPWEGGTDNSPRYDSVLEAIDLESIPKHVKELVDRYRTDDKEGQTDQRPRLHDYYRYLYLVDIFRSLEWDPEAIVRESPFAVKDILVSSLWAASNDALSFLFQELGDEQQSAEFADLTARTKKALQKSWNGDHGLYEDRNVSLGQNTAIAENTIATFLPLFAGAVSSAQLEALLKKLSDRTSFATPFFVPSTPLASQKFDPLRYWRGPTWPITNFFLIWGLDLYKEIPGAAQMRDKILEQTVATITRSGFYEYYDPRIDPRKSDTAGLGFGSFSWTAAIYLILSNLSIEHN